MKLSTDTRYVNVPSHDRCLICYTDILITDCVSNSAHISKQLHVIFTLRKILEIPIEKLVSFLREWDNPSEWIKLCDQCNAVVNNAKNIYDEMLKVQRKFRATQQDIVALAKKSYCASDKKINDEKDGRKRRNGRRGLWKTVALISDECREIVHAREDISLSLTDPFIAGDLWAHSLTTTAGFVKQEPCHELEKCILPDDLTTTGDFNFEDEIDENEDENEDEKEWLPSSTTTCSKKRSMVTSTSKRQNRKRKRQQSSLEEECADAEESQLHVAPPSLLEGYSRKDFQQILKCSLDKDRERGKEVSVDCPLCHSFQCKASQCGVLCDHLEKCKVAKQESHVQLLCPICSHFTREGLDNRVEFVEHLATCTGSRGEVIPPVKNRLFTCSVCDESEKKWMKVNEFLEHYLYHTRYRFKCTKCAHRFVTNESQDTHYHFKVYHTAYAQAHHSTRADYEPNLPEIVWWCPVCSEKFPSDDERDRHCDEVHVNNMGQNEGGKYVCQWCSKSYVCADELRLHQGTQHVYDERQRMGKRRKKSQHHITNSALPIRPKLKKRDQPIVEEYSDCKDDDWQPTSPSEEENSNCKDDDWQPPPEDAVESGEEDEEVESEANVDTSYPATVLERDFYTKQEFLKMVKQQLKIKQLRKCKTPFNRKKLFQCNICPEVQSMKLKAFLEHYLYHKRQTYQCTRCTHRFPSDDSAYTAYHYRHFHPEYERELPITRCIKDPVLPEYSWSCFHCNIRFPTESLRDGHSKMEHAAADESPKHYQCDCCSSCYANVEEFLLHVAATHVQVMKIEGKNLTERKCCVCSQEFSKLSQLQDHQRALHREELFMCHICDRQCKSEYGLRLHMERHEPEKDNIPKILELQEQQNPERRYVVKCLWCPLCKEFKTRGGFGERLCTHLDVCRKKVEWEEKQEHEREPLILHCTLCNVYKTEIENKIELVQHMAWCQGKGDVLQAEPIPPLRSRIFQCSICIKPKKYMKLTKFLTHYLYHKKNQYKCTRCGILHDSQNHANSHFIRKHRDVLKKFPPASRFQYDESLPQFSWWCAYCNAQFSSDDLRDTHVLANHSNAKLPADSKMGKLPPVASLSDGVKEYRCFQCPKAYDVVAELALHEGTTHITENSQFTCDECNRTFVKIKLLRKHKVDKHQADVVVCHICGMTLKGKFLKNHMQTHQQVRSYLCEEPGCEQSFQTKEQRKLHRFRKHTPLDPNKNPLVCPHCPEPKVFHTRSYMNVHIRSFHFNKHQANCHICGKGQQSNSQLQTHLSKVHGIGTRRQHKCSWEGCGKIFYEKYQLRQHMDMHRGEPQFKCSYCAKQFYNRTHLNRHELIHINAESKPYQCEICAKRFPVRNYLYIHMKSHKKNAT